MEQLNDCSVRRDVDRILLIDGANQMWRACVDFDKSEHKICSDGDWCDKCSSSDTAKPNLHCRCGSPWSEEHNYCYGDKFSYVYNFFRNLRPQIEQFQPDKAFIVLEGHPQFRYDIYSDYKANRKIVKTGSLKEEGNKKFSQVRDIIISLLPHLPLTIVKAEKYEADDTIATLCQNMVDEDLTIISGDNDYIQLLQNGYKKLQIYSPIKKTYLKAPAYPYLPWKCLNGDKSDNIKSLLGKKTALKTINDPVLFEKFMSDEERRSLFNINRSLIEFRTVPPEELIVEEGERNWTYLKTAFRTMRFESLIKEPTWTKFTKTFDCIKY